MSRPVWWVVLCKELRDALRDRRALLGLLVFPMLAPLMIYFMLTMVIDRGTAEGELHLPVLGAAHAPELMDYLRQQGVVIEPLWPEMAPVDFSASVTERVHTAIERREQNLILMVPADFPARLAQSRPVNLELHHDSSRQQAQSQVRRVERLLRGWNQETLSLRLLARGISTEVITPARIHLIDTATPRERAQAILGMIPMFVVMAAFFSGMGVAVDQTAGERERKTLEPLLVNPVRHRDILLGKWLTAVCFAIGGLVLVMSFSLLALSRVPLEEIGVSFEPGMGVVLGLLVLTLPLAFLATSIQLCVGLLARSFKDAQAYLSLIGMLPMLPYFLMMFSDDGRAGWMSFIPLLAQNVLLADVISGRAVHLTEILLAGGMALICALLFVAVTLPLLRRERIIF